MFSTEIVVRGTKTTIYAITIGNKCEAREFINEAVARDIREERKLIALLYRIVNEYGFFIRNREKFRHLGDEIWEIKSNQIRLLGFFEDEISRKEFIITHGFIKKRNRTLRRDIDKAIRLRKRYFEKKEN